MTRLAAHEVRKEFADALNRVAYKGERIVVHRRGKDIAAMVPLEDLALIAAMEDKIDLDDAKAAIQEPGTIPWENLKKELGL